MAENISVDSDTENQVNKIERATKKEILTVEDCAKYCDCNKSNIYSAIRRGELKAAGVRNKRITSIALAKWLLGA